MIGVIDYQTGNSQSVVFALDHLHIPNKLVATPADCADVTHFILPGVGSADVTMSSLRAEGWVDHLNEKVVGEHRPFLGICVGLQVVFESSDEGDAACLGWLPGHVREFDRSVVRVPHMGWNVVAPVSEHPFVAGIAPESHFYFVNSFYAVPSNPADVAGVTEYSTRFAAIAARGNIMATQFHAEKSGPLGLRLLGRFASLDKESLC